MLVGAALRGFRLGGRMELPEPERVVPGTAPLEIPYARRPEGRSEVNLKTHFTPNSNTKPDDDPMTGARASCLKTLAEECGESRRRHRHPVH
jgi:hypothetical protein